jgi:hypothetical protein
VSTGDDRELAAGPCIHSIQAGKSGNELFAIEADGTELRRSRVYRELAIQTLGVGFQWLAVVPAAIGFIRVVELFDGADNSHLIGLLGDWSRSALILPRENGFTGLLLPVGLPVVIGVASGWVCFRLGQRLKQHSPWARWVAVVLLAAACVPPLTLFFQAYWGRAYGMAAGTLVIAAIPAGLALTLSTSASDAIFTPEYRTLLGTATLRRDERSAPADLLSTIGLIGLGVTAVLILVILAQ